MQACYPWYNRIIPSGMTIVQAFNYQTAVSAIDVEGAHHLTLLSKDFFNQTANIMTEGETQKLETFEQVAVEVQNLVFSSGERDKTMGALQNDMEKLNKYVHNELMKLQELLSGKKLKKMVLAALKEDVLDRLDALEEGQGAVDVTEITNQITVSRTEIEEKYQAEILKLQEQIAVLVTRADASDTRIKELEAQLGDKSKDGDLKEEIDKLKKDLEEQNEKLKKDVEEQNEKLKKDVDENKDDLEKLKKEVSDLRDDLEKLKQKEAEDAAKAEEAKKNADSELEKLKKDIRGVKHDIKKLKTKPEGEGEAPVSPREAEAPPSEEVLKSIEEAKDEAEKALKEAKEAKEEAEKALKEAKEAKEDAEKAKKDAKDADEKAEKAQKDAKDAEEKAEKAKKDVEKFISEAPRGETTTATVVERSVDMEVVNELRKELDEARKDARDAKDDADKAKKEAAEAKKEAEAEDEKIKKDLKSIKSEIKKLKDGKPSGGEGEPQALERSVALDDPELRDTLDKAAKDASIAKDEAERANAKLKELDSMVQYLRKEAGGSRQPDVSQVFVDLPQAAAVQLVFRAQQQVQVVKK